MQDAFLQLSFEQLKLVSIGELCRRIDFFIPDYQRGYRWDEAQVLDLLEDISEYATESATAREKGEEPAPYCLQPLVAMEKTVLKNGQTGYFYEVIDGQQRLTTIRLILGFLGYGAGESYSLRYETRQESKAYIEAVIALQDPGAQERAEIEKKSEANIDYAHIWQAYVTIEKYLTRKDEAQQALFEKALLERVKFIWYQPEHTDKDDEDAAVAVFRRLNVGKIELTDSELIKALLLNRAYVNEGEDENLSIMQQEIALQWDMVENALGDNEFWYFLTCEKPTPTRIDFIFKLIYELEAFGKKEQWEAYQAYKTFRYVDAHLKQTKTLGSRAEGITSIWSKVMELYLLFREWYQDSILYHYVGFLLSKEGKVGIAKIYHLWKSAKSKAAFLDELRQEVWKCSMNHVRVEGKPSVCGWHDVVNQEEGVIKENLYDSLSHMDYHPGNTDYKVKCRSLLLLHNVQTIVIQNRKEKNNYELAVFYKFPFHLYNRIDWEVEHIDAATPSDMTGLKDRKAWLLNAYCLLMDEKSLDEMTEIRSKMTAFWQSQNDGDMFTEVVNAMMNLSPLLAASENNSPQKNGIENFALLDGSTNSMYQNAIFPVKRKILMERERGESLPSYDWDCEKKELKRVVSKTLSSAAEIKSTFVPPCTMAAFLKKYSGHNANPNRWAEEDAEAYLNDICEKLTDFIVN